MRSTSGGRFSGIRGPGTLGQNSVTTQLWVVMSCVPQLPVLKLRSVDLTIAALGNSHFGQSKWTTLVHPPSIGWLAAIVKAICSVLQCGHLWVTVAMIFQSKMQRAEKEIREIIRTHDGASMGPLMRAYSNRTGDEKEAFAAVLIGRVAISAIREKQRSKTLS